MNARKIISSGVIAIAFLGAGIVSAQVVGTTSGAPVTVTTTPVTTAPGSGTSGATLGTITLTATGQGTYSISSIPVTLTAANGGVATDLSNCQLYNTNNGEPLNTGGNIPGTVVSGTNTLTLDTPLTVTAGQTTTLNVRCNVASGALSGSTYNFVAGAPTFAPSLMTTLIASPSVDAGEQNAPLAIIAFDATRSGANATVSSIPVTLTFNGAPSNDFTNCGLENVAAMGTMLNTNTNAVSSVNATGATTFTLDTPISVPMGTVGSYLLTCDVSSATPVGSTINASIAPASIPATNPATGLSVTPTAAFSATGGTDPVSGTIAIVAPGTIGTTGTVTTPGAPDTGAGGFAPMNALALALSASAAIGAAFVLLRSRLFSLNQ